MTIIVERQCHQSRFEKEMSEVAKAARRMSGNKLASMHEFLIAKQKKDNKLKTAAIKRYARKHGLVLWRHCRPWTVQAVSGEKFAMPVGYYAMVNGVVENIVAK